MKKDLDFILKMGVLLKVKGQYKFIPYRRYREILSMEKGDNFTSPSIQSMAAYIHKEIRK